jgi:uncharacterized membrane protein
MEVLKMNKMNLVVILLCVFAGLGSVSYIVYLNKQLGKRQEHSHNLQNNKRLRFMLHAAIIAAMYAALTLAFVPISYGQLQVRVSEVLTVLPFFTPAAVPGLFIGCLIANLASPIGIVDVVFGSLATLIAAYLTSKVKRTYLAPLPPVIVNGIVIGFELYYVYKLPLLPSMGWVALGEIISCYTVGYFLVMALYKNKNQIFGDIK